MLTHTKNLETTGEYWSFKFGASGVRFRFSKCSK